MVSMGVEKKEESHIVRLDEGARKFFGLITEDVARLVGCAGDRGVELGN